MSDQRWPRLHLLPDTVKDLTPKEVDHLDELFGRERPVVTTEDGIAHMGIPSSTEWDETKKWNVKVTDWNDVVVYEGPAPVPDDVGLVDLDDLSDGRCYLFEMTPVE